VSYIDIILIVPILWAAFKGFKKGFIIGVFSLLALFAGIYAGLHFSNYMSDALSSNFNISSEYLPLTSFILTFLIVLIGVYYLGKALEKVVKMASLEFLNKLAGSFFGLLKGVLIMSLLVLCFHSINTRVEVVDKEQLDKSILYNPLRVFTLAVLPVIYDSEWFDEIKDWEPLDGSGV
jgi:membrane protein required for colicin V production